MFSDYHTCELNLICSAYFVSAFENWLLLTVMGWAALAGWNAQKKHDVSSYLNNSHWICKENLWSFKTKVSATCINDFSTLCIRTNSLCKQISDFCFLSLLLGLTLVENICRTMTTLLKHWYDTPVYVRFSSLLWLGMGTHARGAQRGLPEPESIHERDGRAAKLKIHRERFPDFFLVPG